MFTTNSRPTTTYHHVPLDFNVNSDGSNSILDPHQDNLESLSTHDYKRQRVMQKILALISWSSSSPRHPDWPPGLERHCRHIRSKPFKKCVDSIMRLLIICPPGPDSVIEANRVSNLGSSKTIEGATFDSFVEEDLKSAMQPGVARYLQVWLLAPDDAKSQSCFSFFHQLAETLRNRLHEMYKAPSQALALSVADIWGADVVSRGMLSNLISPSPRYPSLQLPSMRQSEEEITFFSQLGTSFTLEWQNQVLKYENDLKIYVWQPHLQKRPNVYNVINIVIMPARDGESQQRMAMSLHPPSLLSAFLQFQQTRMSAQILLDRHPWSAKHELFLTLVTVLDWMATDITSFVDNIAYQLREMTIKGRRLPSRSKVQYLLHLDDCRRRGIEDLSHGLRLLQRVLRAVESKAFCCQETEDRADAVKRVLTTRDDLRFLRGRLNSLARPITTIREQVVEQMDLSQSQRGLILTIVAALFVPLSFVSSVFGMNISKEFFPPSGQPKKSSSSSMTIASTVASVVTTASTPVITPRSILMKRGDDDNDQHYFTMAQYLKVALPMTGAVIILPLIIGPLVRFSFQKAFYYRRSWRLFSLLGALLYFGLVYGFLYWYHDSCKHGCPGFWWYSRNYVTFVMYLVLVAGALGIISVVQLFRAYKKKTERPRWTIFAMLVVSCVIGELFVDYPGLPAWGYYITSDIWVELRPIPLTWIPFVFLIISWSIPRFQGQQSSWNPISRDSWRRSRNADPRLI